MKYSEFKAEVEKTGLHLGVFESYVDIFDKHGNTVSRVAKYVEMGIDTEYEEFQKLTQEQRAAVFEALYKLAKTPLAEREEEKRYRLLSVSPMLRKNECGYLLYHREYDKYYTGNTDHWGLVYQTIFTESEIAQMDITGFVKVEVTE